MERSAMTRRISIAMATVLLMPLVATAGDAVELRWRFEKGGVYELRQKGETRTETLHTAERCAFWEEYSRYMPSPLAPLSIREE